MMVAARFFVQGRVQGVFYRASTRSQAQVLGLRGYVRNLSDGRVEVLVEGTPEAIAALKVWLWQGPELARVDAVQQVTAEVGEAGSGFTIG